MAFLPRKSLIIHNQKRVKNHLKLVQKELMQEVERIVNEETIPLEHQEDKSIWILRKSMANILDKNLKFWTNETV